MAKDARAKPSNAKWYCLALRRLQTNGHGALASICCRFQYHAYIVNVENGNGHYPQRQTATDLLHDQSVVRVLKPPISQEY